MRKRFDQSAVMVMAAVLLLSTAAPAQKDALPFPQGSAKKAQESDALVVWDVTWVKGKSTGMHEHQLDQVSVALTEGAVKVTRPDGTWTIEQQRVGSVRFEPKGTVDAEEGVSDNPCRTMIFQLKDSVPSKAPTTPGIPGQFPRVGATELFETDRIRVWDATWKEHTALHLHYALTAAVFLEGGSIQSFSAQGVVEHTSSREPGSILMGAPIKAPHSEQQSEGSPRAIFIEFK